MKYLLDTCAWLWLLDSPERLSSAAAAILRDLAVYPVGIAGISLWEVARKESLGKLVLKCSCDAWLRDATTASGIDCIPLSHRIAWESCHLPGDFHRDPADQIIVATARALDLTLITSDERILGYAHVRSIQA